VVGIVIVSHSHAIAEGTAELAREMGGSDVRVETAGGLDLPEHPVGTDAVLVQHAIERAWSDDGVLVLMDLGSAVLSAEMALDLLGDRRSGVVLCEAPLVEGAVAAAVTAKMGAPLASVATEARGGLAGKVAHLGTPADEAGPATGGTTADTPERGPSAEPAVSVRITIGNPHGLHARPAARFVQTASSFDAEVSVRDLTNGRGPAPAGSLNAVATLGAATGHEIEVSASGTQAAEAIAAIRSLAGRNFDEGPDGSTPPAPAAAVDLPRSGSLDGLPASPGIALGDARRSHVVEPLLPDVEPGDPDAEADALERALERTAVDIERQRRAAAARAGEDAATIFDAHLLFLRDEALLAPARRAIHAEHVSAARAWRSAVEATAARWDELEDEYLRARADDLRSVGAQVLSRLLGVEPPRPRMSGPGILVASDLAPADTAGLDPTETFGLATARGGPTSHAAVLARSIGIPAVVGVGPAILDVPEGTPLALDGDAGVVFVEPTPEERSKLRAVKAERDATLAEARASAGSPALSEDGTEIEVSANVSSPDEVAAALAVGADGVGLFRTEFLFMDRPDVPGEDEQEAAYRAAARALDGRPLLIRTLDAGADKPVPSLGQPPEANPFLGVRGVRLGLERPDMLRAQLRAIVRVAADHPVRVMFPMVATIGELLAARRLLDESRRGVGAGIGLEVGIMVEVPAAGLVAGSLAEYVDFFSIGTNDLTQYVMAADRGNERVAALSDAVHPAVLGLIRATTKGATEHGRWVGVCGEIAGDPTATPLLLGLGVRELSMAAPAIAGVKQAVRGTDLREASTLADRALAFADAAAVRALLGGGEGRDRSAVTMPRSPS
jgi:multiphosphoryl transfer protein